MSEKFQKKCQVRQLMFDTKRKSLIYMLYKYTFSLRNEIGTCPSIDIEVIGYSLFFIRSFHAKENKQYIDNEMK